MTLTVQGIPQIVVSRQTGEWFRVYADLSNRQMADLVETALRDWIATRIREWLELDSQL